MVKRNPIFPYLCNPFHIIIKLNTHKNNRFFNKKEDLLNSKSLLQIYSTQNGAGALVLTPNSYAMASKIRSEAFPSPYGLLASAIC